MNVSSRFTCLILYVLFINCANSTPSFLRKQTNFPNIVDAFRKDGFDVVSSISTSSGNGYRAHSKNATLYVSKAPKTAFYVSGSPYDMGYQYGRLSANETYLVSTTWVDHFAPALIDAKLDQKLANNTLYNVVVTALADVIVNSSVRSFYENLPSGFYPKELLSEIQGICDGANSVLPPNNQVSFDRLLTINYGFDYISAAMFTGNILNLLKRAASYLGANKATLMTISQLNPNVFRVPLGCQAFSVGGSSLAPDQGPLFARDFMFATAEILQEYLTTIIYVPNDGRLPIVAVNAPGMVGAITSMNSAGFSMGVDTLRGINSNFSRPGFNSIGIVRETAHYAKTTSDAIEYIVNAPRGTAYMYPMQDASGAGAVLEAGYQTDSNTVPDFTTLIENKKLSELLPNMSYLNQISPIDFRRGVAVRTGTYKIPTEKLLPFNQKLFEYANYPFNKSTSTWGIEGVLFQTFEEEAASWSSLGPRYFLPERLPWNMTDVVVVTNNAITPQMHLVEMPFWPSIFPGEAIRWRYDQIIVRLMNAIHSNGLTFEEARDIISFLRPDETPGFYPIRINPNDANTTVIQGAMALVDNRKRVLESKTGYYGDAWVHISLLNYI